MPISRREMLRGSMGLAAAGVMGLWLRAEAQPTESSGDLGDFAPHIHEGVPVAPAADAAPAVERWAPTEDNILGPFHRPGAPFRGKITPPLEPGNVLLISGRVWGHDTRRPLANAVLDIWQANAEGRYDNDDPRNPPARGVYRNRARLITDENGYYEYETIHPGHYRLDARQFRPAHIHYWIRHPGYRQLVTQLYFKGDPHNDVDPFIRPSLIIELHRVEAGQRQYHAGVFDIVLAKA